MQRVAGLISGFHYYAAAYIFIELALKEKGKRRRWWQTELFTGRPTNGGNSLIQDLRTREINGQFQNIFKMSFRDFDYIINFIGPKIAKNYTLKQPIFVQEKLCPNKLYVILLQKLIHKVCNTFVYHHFMINDGSLKYRQSVNRRLVAEVRCKVPRLFL